MPCEDIQSNNNQTPPKCSICKGCSLYLDKRTIRQLKHLPLSLSIESLTPILMKPARLSSISDFLYTQDSAVPTQLFVVLEEVKHVHILAVVILEYLAEAYTAWTFLPMQHCLQATCVADHDGMDTDDHAGSQLCVQSNELSTSYRRQQ
jgi:hypothetical protein